MARWISGRCRRGCHAMAACWCSSCTGITRSRICTRAEAPLARGFEILDRDHHALDDLLERFTRSANSVLQGGEPGPFREELVSFQRFLGRHLEDEEELVVPVILKHGADGLH